MTFDIKAQQTIDLLMENLGGSYIPKPALNSPYSIGIEIEVKFKYYFPQIYKDFFEGRKYFEYSDEEKERISRIIAESEKSLLLLLEKTIECGIPRGNDKYWEFSFAPVHNMTLLIYQVEILRAVNLLPKGRHSLHISIGGLKKTPDVFYMLMILELLFADKERIQKGFSKEETYADTWAKKGWGGVLEKNQYDLVDQNVGVEFRTLYIDDQTDLFEMFSLLKRLFEDHEKKMVTALEEKTISIGLPKTNWERPHLQPAIWKRYINNFDYLSEFVKEEII